MAVRGFLVKDASQVGLALRSLSWRWNWRLSRLDSQTLHGHTIALRGVFMRTPFALNCRNFDSLSLARRISCQWRADRLFAAAAY